MPRRRLHHRLLYFTSSFGVVLGLVLIWRGIWYVLDAIDKLFFSGSHLLTALGGVILGLLILYLPDKNLDELRKL
ncbi:MAG: hypothetical protein HYZ63_01555 [Candidatus Andersenbacteria bacterium]|nr:hypothetical protein [Candidatus Andersenbacteria bacterium]